MASGAATIPDKINVARTVGFNQAPARMNTFCSHQTAPAASNMMYEGARK